METRGRFTAVWDAGNWHVEATEAAASGPLEELFREQARLQALPPDLPVVGHCPFGARYCVFTRRAGDPVVRGLLLEPAEYRSLDFDPFLASARLIGEPSLAALTDAPPAPSADARSRTAATADYLEAAYACFLATPPAGRRGGYLSLLPTGTPPEVSPLSCFTAPRPAPADADDPGAHLGALELSRDGMPPAEPAGRSQDEPAADDLLGRLAAEHRRLRRALVLTWVGLVLLAIGAAGAAWVGRGRLEALERDKLDTAVVVDGLGLAPGDRAREAALQASLRDLATVTVQSGAWQAGLESRGVEPDRFLGTMVELAARADELERLAGVATPLTRLAPASGPLIQLARQEGTLGELAAVTPALTALAEQTPALSALAGQRQALEDLAARRQALTVVAEASADLVAVARLRAQLERLSARATAVLNVAEQGAPLLVFFERRQVALERLAEQQQALSELVARRAALERLATASSALLQLSDSRGLRQLAAQDAEVVVLAQHLDELAELARRAEELLGAETAP